MARPSCPKSTVREKGPKANYHQSIPSFPPSSHSNPKAQHRSQLALPSHNLSPLEILLLQPIEFIKTQTTSNPLTDDQTINGIGYFNNKKIKGMGNSVSSKHKAVKRRGDIPAKNVHSQEPDEGELPGQSQRLYQRRVVGESSTGKTANKISVKKAQAPFIIPFNT